MIPTPSFSELRQLVSIEQVLARRQLLASLQHRPDRLVGPCPIHGGDNPRAFVVSLSKELWFCFTRCRRGGDVLDLVRLLDNCGHIEAAQYLAALAASTSSSPRPIVPAHQGPSVFHPFSRRLRLDPADPFLADKGIHHDTASRFEAGRFDGRGWLEDCVAVRLHDPQGIPLGYAGRQLDAFKARRYGKWKLPPRFPRSSTLYNLHRVRERLDRGLALVECPWAVMRLHQIGVPAVALLGTDLSSSQRALLASVARLLLLMDGDEPGRHAANRLRSTFPSTIQVNVARLPDGHDPDDLDDDSLRALSHPIA